MTCFFCGGDIEEKKTAYKTEIGGRVVIIRGVPSHVCAQCGAVSYGNDVAKRIEAIVKSLKGVAMEIVISDFAA